MLGGLCPSSPGPKMCPVTGHCHTQLREITRCQILILSASVCLALCKEQPRFRKLHQHPCSGAALGEVLCRQHQAGSLCWSRGRSLKGSLSQRRKLAEDRQATGPEGQWQGFRAPDPPGLLLVCCSIHGPAVWSSVSGPPAGSALLITPSSAAGMVPGPLQALRECLSNEATMAGRVGCLCDLTYG